MGRFGSALGAGLALLISAAPAHGMTVEEVIAKHVAARGGKANWDAIQTIQVKGTFTAFSVEAPFTLTRKKPDRYHLDHTQAGKIVIAGYDGEKAWWDNHWMQPGATPVSGPDLGVVLRDADFPNPLFHYREKGYGVKLLGDVEFEGIPAIGIELTRGEEVETWYLDPVTYLEAAKVSPGSDFGRPMPQRTFYDDWREVAGVKIAHLTETQWYTRDRVMVIEDLQVNLPVDDALFRMPLPPGMAPLQHLAGAWHIALSQRPQPGADWQESERTSTIEALLGGTLFRETFTASDGSDVIRTLSFDRYRQRYRLTQISSDLGMMDIREGTFDEGGRLALSNQETGTSDQFFGQALLGRLSFLDLQPDRFQMEWESSLDGGENWLLVAKAVYSRAPAAAADE